MSLSAPLVQVLIWEVIPFLLVCKLKMVIYNILVLEWNFTMAFAGVEVQVHFIKQQYHLSLKKQNMKVKRRSSLWLVALENELQWELLAGCAGMAVPAQQGLPGQWSANCAQFRSSPADHCSLCMCSSGSCY